MASLTNSLTQSDSFAIKFRWDQSIITIKHGNKTHFHWRKINHLLDLLIFNANKTWNALKKVASETPFFLRCEHLHFGEYGIRMKMKTTKKDTHKTWAITNHMASVLKFIFDIPNRRCSMETNEFWKFPFEQWNWITSTKSIHRIA